MKVNIDKIKDRTTTALSKTKNAMKNAETTITKSTSNIAKKATENIDLSKEKIVKAMDQNGDGQLTIEDVIIAGLKIPGIKINRTDFLKAEFTPYVSENIINKIIETSPSRAGINSEIVDKIAKDVIQYERLCVSGISTALSFPGGIAMVATLPTDIAQFYGYMLRAAQKLLYLYGFPEIDINNEQMLDAATMNTIILCIGVMYGVAGANSALKMMAKALGKGVEKKLINAALTKGTIYPIVKSTAKWFHVRMTKEIFAGFFKKSIPAIGGVIGGTITYATFKPCCERLQSTLKQTRLASNMINDDDIKEIIINEDSL